MSRNTLTHTILGLGLAIFFFSPAYKDYDALSLIPFAIPLPSILAPLILLACVGAWLWLVGEGNLLAMSQRSMRQS